MSWFTHALRLGFAFASTSALGRRSRIVTVFDVILGLYHTGPEPANDLADVGPHADASLSRNKVADTPQVTPSYLPSNSLTIVRSSFSSFTVAVIFPRLNSLMGTPCTTSSFWATLRTGNELMSPSSTP
jgi:hypothetical protein